MEVTLVVRTRADAIPVIAALGRILEPGRQAVAAFDAAGEFGVVVEVTQSDSLAGCVELLAQICAPGEHLLIVSNRTGEVPADRPDDELTWEELVGIAREWDVTLWDWWVVWGTKAFSLAEFAPTPAAWPASPGDVRPAAG